MLKKTFIPDLERISRTALALAQEVEAYAALPAGSVKYDVNHGNGRISITIEGEDTVRGVIDCLRYADGRGRRA